MKARALLLSCLWLLLLSQYKLSLGFNAERSFNISYTRVESDNADEKVTLECVTKVPDPDIDLTSLFSTVDFNVSSENEKQLVCLRKLNFYWWFFYKRLPGFPGNTFGSLMTTTLRPDRGTTSIDWWGLGMTSLLKFLSFHIPIMTPVGSTHMTSITTDKPDTFWTMRSATWRSSRRWPSSGVRSLIWPSGGGSRPLRPRSSSF